MNFLEFFIPDFSELLQKFFSFGIFGLLLITVTLLFINAKSKNWEKNWNGNLSSDDSLLGSEQGTIYDISEAVATKSEKLSESMPSFLLMIGLLGTFLGLGIALNDASEIIGGKGGLSGQNYDDIMTKLNGMMTGLGTKFKASIWGISGFIILRVINGASQVDKKRLDWCAAKIKEDNAIKNDLRSKHESLRLDQTITASEKLGDNINSVLLDGFEKQALVMKQNLEVIEKTHLQNIELGSEFKQLSALLSNVFSNLSHLNEKLVQESETNNEKLDDLVSGLFEFKSECLDMQKQNAITSHKVVSEIVNLEKSLVTNGKEHLDSVNQGFQDITQCLSGIGVASRESSEKIVLQLKDSSEKTEANLQKISKDFERVASATQESSKQMKEFSQSTKSSLTTLGVSSERMEKASVGIQQGASKLSSAVGNFENNIRKVMNKVSTDLDGTISNMSNTFTDSMSTMAQDMSSSTHEISNAVKSNAKSVEATMATVKSSISDSLKIQQKSSAEFQLSSQTLNETMEEVTALVTDLKESIQSGLSAVSRSGKEVKSLNQAYKSISSTVTESYEQNKLLLSELNAICSEIKRNNDTSYVLKSSLENGQKQSLEKISVLIGLLRDSNENKSELNEIKELRKSVSDYYKMANEERRLQPTKIKEALSSINSLEKISNDLVLNNRELRGMSDSLQSISLSIEELSTKNIRNDVVPA
ncbi:coiled-coil domain-containing protein [Pseudoalteromonas lipolytica]|uniref:MotA/TolQ/ExbB proton channel domain-containing protein n=1 Tax=Pseudoalteromonas lipolytica TaxID=570156 RepID=A0ABY1GJR1_9GAMM|nr:hypothetical protein [Pseudoalteromonas lipolytica]MBE0351768.1 hypothetical protein [Pseudoalteromonas lipolytica LMEB 39]SFT87162.1 hypothetical protein SAMN04487854_11313 [Pseudoalteromonas lipolytica]